MRLAASRLWSAKMAFTSLMVALVIFSDNCAFFAEKDNDMRHIMHYGKEYYIVARLITYLTRARGQRRYTRYTEEDMSEG